MAPPAEGSWRKEAVLLLALATWPEIEARLQRPTDASAPTLAWPPRSWGERLSTKLCEAFSRRSKSWRPAVRRTLRAARVPAFLAAVFGSASVSNEASAGEGWLSASATYSGEAWRNTRGGIRPGDAWLGKGRVELAAGGWVPGIRGLLAVSHVSGDQPSADRVGDRNGLSNIEGPDGLIVEEAWLERDFGEGSVKAGVLDLNAEIDVNEVGGLFLSGAHGIGPEFSQAGPDGPSIFPLQALGVRFEGRLPGGAARLVVADGAPGRGSRPVQDFAVGRSEGALVAAELEMRSERRPRILLGVWRHPGAHRAEGRGRAGRGTGAYVLIETAPRAVGTGQAQAFLRAGLAEGPEFQIADYLGAGLVFDGFGDPGRENAIGMALASTRSRLRAADPLEPLPHRETTLELTYRTKVSAGLSVQPNLQWVRFDGGPRRDAVVIGMRLEAKWELRR